MKYLKIQLLILLLCPLAFATGGKETGNGGHAIVCRDSANHILSVEVLDLYEARTNHKNWKLNLGDPNLPYPQKISMALERLARFSPKRAAHYQELANSFDGEALFKNGVVLELIPDAANVDVPEGCKLEQLVNQKKPVLDGDPRYVVNGDLWDKMDNDQRAGIILHEIAYREVLDYGHQYSTSARWLVGYMATTAIDRATPKEFLTSIQNLAFKITDIGSYDVYLVQCDNSSLVDGEYESRNDCRTPGNIASKSKMEFYPSGNLRTISLMSERDIGTLTLQVSPTTSLEIFGPGYVFADTIRPQIIDGTDEKTIKDPYHTCKIRGDFQLSSDGNIGSITNGECWPVQPSTIRDVSARKVQFVGSSEVLITNGWIQGPKITVTTRGTLGLTNGPSEAQITCSGPSETSLSESVSVKANTAQVSISGTQFKISAKEIELVRNFPLLSLSLQKYNLNLFPLVGTTETAFEWNSDGHWTTTGLAFDFNQTQGGYSEQSFGNGLLVTVDKKPLPVLPNDFEKISDSQYRFKIQREASYNGLMLKPLSPIEVSTNPKFYYRLTSFKAILAVDSTYEGVKYKKDTEIVIADDSRHFSRVQSGVLAEDSMLSSCDNYFHHDKLFKAGSRVEEVYSPRTHSSDICFRTL